MGLWRAWRRRRLAREPLPAAWEAHLEALPLYRTLPDAERARLRNLVNVFAREKQFVGAGGLKITDEMRVVISACAVRLVLHLGLGYYDRLDEIVLYPYVFHHPDNDQALLGEAKDWGTVVLSWPSVVEGVRNPGDGHDTATHEFAHVLDRADGAYDGTPPLRSPSLYAPWARILSRHYLALRRGSRPERRVLREYGATNEAEFFAVATESFFERPRRMKKFAPDLYEELREFYGSDPSEPA